MHKTAAANLMVLQRLFSLYAFQHAGQLFLYSFFTPSCVFSPFTSHSAV